MSSKTTAQLDLTKELRLRRWARQNYVAIDSRSGDWHAVVLDEMERRDVELTDRPAVSRMGGGFVPLPPTELRRLDEAHDAVGEPNMLQTADRVSSHGSQPVGFESDSAIG